MNVKSSLQSQKRGIDFSLLVIILVLVVFGLVMVYDASVIQGLKDFNDSLHYIRQQLIWVILGIAAMVFFINLNFRKLKKFAVPAILLSFLLLVAVLLPGLGISGGGAHRWLSLGPITIQPAEIIKLTSIIFLAAIFEKRAKFFPFALLVASVAIVTAVFQKDLGTSVVFVTTGVLMYFAANAPIWHFLVTIPLVVVAAVALILTSDYRSKRVLAFLDPFSDTQGFTYHISQVLIALGSGGLFGLGLGHSRQKFEYIPQVATDSIFGIIGEELGFVGAGLLVIFFMVVVFKGLKISAACQDNFGKLLALGITSWIGIQVIINISSMTALLPLTGVPLPFISYGGSALVANLAAIGILLNISKQST